MSKHQQNRVKRVASLLREFDFEVRGKDIWTSRIGFMPARPFGRRCRDIFDGAEQLIPIIRYEDYQRRLRAI